MSEKKFKVGDVVVSPSWLRRAPQHGVVAWVGKRWFTVSFDGREPSTRDRWDAFTGVKDSNCDAPRIMLVEEYEAREREDAARNALFAVGLRLERGSDLTAVAVLAAIKPLLEAP